MEDKPIKKDSSLSIPVAIVVAGIIIALAVIFTGGDSGNQATGGEENTERETGVASENIRRVEEGDYIRGKPDAKVSIIEFSDFECPFCARVHPTLEQVLEEYPDEVNWVYRHLPLASHSQALGAAIASECVGSLAGNEAFWDFTDKIFANQRSVGPELYEQIARDNGVDLAEFATCIEDDSIAQGVRDDLSEAQSVPVPRIGTPLFVVITASNDIIPFSGALPIESFREVVQQALES